MGAEIIGLSTPVSSSTPWEEIRVILPPPRPRIEPGQYQARTVGLKRLETYGRQTAEILFEIYRDEWTAANVLAIVPCYVPLPGKRGLSPNSKLCRMLNLAGIKPSRKTQTSLAVLKHKVFLVQIGDNEKDGDGLPVTADSAYSVVKRVLERL
jgi:hypothetical protein